MEEPKDKRTNEYKQWKKSQGLGDTIEKIAKVTGIKKVVDFLFDDCGCDERKKYFNKKFSYKVECFDKEDFDYLKVLYDANVNKLNLEQRVRILSIYNKTFSKRMKQTTCSSCWISILRELKVVYNEYNK